VSHAAKIYGTYDKIPEELMTPYQLADGQRGALLHEVFWRLVEPKSEYFNEIELIKTTVDTEQRGFMVDQSEAKKLLKWMQDELEQNTRTTSQILGRYVNLLSEKQVKALLYNELKLPRQETIDKVAMEELRRVSNHPVIDCILKARSYTKGTAMINGYLKAAERDGCVHPNIRTNKASTGRESSDNPNLQNVSKEVKAGARFTVPARRCFRSRPGKILFMADYSGIEMRLAVQGTGSERLFQLCKDGYDFHTACATTFYGIKFTDEKDEKAKKALRSRAKNARFAMLYGAGLEQTANTLGLSIEETEAGYNRDKEEFPEFYELMSRCTQHAKKYGYITTFFGRKLRVPRDRPYAATDLLIQGSAAALFKHAQNDVHRLFQGVPGANIILPVHDELVMEIDRGIDLTKLAPLIKAKMIEHPQVVVKLDVDFSVSTTTWDKRYDRHY
jgi:DNA polymerase-1